MTEKEKYLATIEVKKSLGLKSITFFVNPGIKSTEEEIYAELNRMFAAPSLPDPEVLGRYSP